MQDGAMTILRSIFAGAALLALPVEAQEHRFEVDPVVTVRENFVACDVLSQLQRVMGNPRFLLAGEMRPAARRRSSPRLRKARAVRLHLSARHDFALQMDA
jgi:hypothetical protein